MKIYKLLAVVLLSLSFGFTYGQRGKIVSANSNYDKFSYIKTSNLLLEVAENGYESADLFQKLGNAFYFNNKMEEASKWYAKLMLLNEEIDSEYYFRYAQALKFIENYDESDKWMRKFYDLNPEFLNEEGFISSKDYLTKINDRSKLFNVYNLNTNTALSDFGSNEYQGKLVFASSRGKGRIYKWNEQPFLDLYITETESDSTLIEPVSFSNEINTKMHESTVSFMPSDSVMYFTRNNYYNGRLKKDNLGVNRLQIYYASLGENNKWGDIKSIHFNSNDYSVAHPAVNVDGTKLYFASDMSGTFGGSDLFVAAIHKDGSLGKPQNLGALINTVNQESFPFMSKKGDLYFSSNRFNGLGGLDVYVIKNLESQLTKGKGLKIENLGNPINSSQDDFGFYVNTDNDTGYFTSNRPGGKGDDDIYAFEKIDCQQQISGTVIDKKTKKLLAGSTVTLHNAKNEVVEQVVVGLEANFLFKAECAQDYLIKASFIDYMGDEKRILQSLNEEGVNITLALVKDVVEVSEGTNLREVLDLNPIYFDFDQSNIRPDAEIELQKIIAAMKAYPTLIIDVRSHTDSRAPKVYNQALSQRRNEATIKYIIDKGGINRARLTGKGYGESELLNKCADNIMCSEEEHQLNRRSDFIIVSM